MREIISEYKILIGKSKVVTPCRKPRRKWEDKKAY
jgi:hypothetical protein